MRAGRSHWLQTIARSPATSPEAIPLGIPMRRSWETIIAGAPRMAAAERRNLRRFMKRLYSECNGRSHKLEQPFRGVDSSGGAGGTHQRVIGAVYGNV